MSAVIRALLSCALMYVAGSARAEELAPPAPDSPMASVVDFGKAASANDFATAARFLDLPNSEVARGPQLARRLKAVVDRHLPLSLEELSREPQGNRDDGLPPGMEEIGRIPVAGKASAPVRLVQKKTLDGDRWLFARETVKQVDGWYAELDEAWLLDRIPPLLVATGPFGILRWQWVGLVAIAVLAWGIALPVAFIVGRVLHWLMRRTSLAWDDIASERMRGPIHIGVALGVFSLGLPFLKLYAPQMSRVDNVLHALVVALGFWVAVRAVQIAVLRAKAAAWTVDHPEATFALSLGSRVGTLGLTAVGVVAVLADLGYPVLSILTGLGIGGLALALAAQKTFENLFGAVALGLDKPFRVGEVIRLGTLVGTVEGIGLRSTKIRLLDRVVVTVPNGHLAEQRIENLSARDRFSLDTKVNLVQRTNTAQVLALREAILGYLQQHPNVWQESVTVNLVAYDDSALRLELKAWMVVATYERFEELRTDALLRIRDLVNEAGSDFAYPTQTVYLEQPRPS